MHSSTSSTISTTIRAPLAPVPMLVRPWSAPLPGVARASRVRRAWGTGALVAGAALLGASASWVGLGGAPLAPVPSAQAAVVRPADPPCGYVVEGRTLWVKSLSAHGRVRVYRGFDKVRDRHSLKPGESMVIRLKRSGHSERDLVAYVGKSECEPA